MSQNYSCYTSNQVQFVALVRVPREPLAGALQEGEEDLLQGDRLDGAHRRRHLQQVDEAEEEGDDLVRNGDGQVEEVLEAGGQPLCLNLPLHQSHKKRKLSG